jgi:anti-sigma regulatory factor (Ser/Thr protein kinase)
MMIAELGPIVMGVIAAASAAHPSLSAGGERTRSSAPVKPAAFLTDAPEGWPDLRSTRPGVAMTLDSLGDLRQARQLLLRSAESASAVDRATICSFSAAVHEVLVNALTHGAPPVDLIVWVETSRLTCEVIDCGEGVPDNFFGDQRPTTRAMGLRVARDMCGELIVINQPGGGCSVIMTTA